MLNNLFIISEMTRISEMNRISNMNIISEINILSDMNIIRPNARVHVGTGNISDANNRVSQLNTLNITLPHNIGLKS